MPSVSTRIRIAAIAPCLVLIGIGFGGCETTQEKAEKQQARAAHILKAREERRAERKAKQHHEEEKK